MKIDLNLNLQSDVEILKLHLNHNLQSDVEIPKLDLDHNLQSDVEQNRSAEGYSKLKRSVDMTSSGKNGLNIRTNASPKWDRTRCPKE